MEKVRNFLLGIKDGFTTIWTMQDKWLYLAHTIFIWECTGDVLRVHFAIPDTDSMPISAVLCAFVAEFCRTFTNGGFEPIHI
jgi:hypothetical protein